MAVLDVLAPGLLVLCASGVTKLLRPAAEVNDVRKLQRVGIVLLKIITWYRKVLLTEMKQMVEILDKIALIVD